MAQRHQGDARAEDPPPAHHRSLGELQQRIEHGDAEAEMVVNPQGIVPAALDRSTRSLSLQSIWRGNR